jgi:raffinose/stachyose/melibiose transport system permease protein
MSYSDLQKTGNSSAIPSPIRERTRLRWHGFKEDWFKYLFGIIIPLILFCIFVGYPIIGTIQLSFFKWNGFSFEKEFVGLDNFKRLIADPNFVLSFVNNIKWFILTLIFPVFGGLVFAAILSSNRIYLTKLFLVLMLLPITLSMVTIGVMFGLILNPVFGALNLALGTIGLDFLQTDWLGPNIALYTLIAVGSWSFIGMTTLMFHAAMTQVPEELYDTAKIEGANAVQTFRYVTLPMIRSVIAVVTILVAINSLRAFDLVLVMTRGGPFKKTNVLGYFMWNESFYKMRFGYGAAIGTSILLLSSLFIIFYIRNSAGEALQADN